MELHQLPTQIQDNVSLYCKAFNTSVKSIDRAQSGYFDNRDGSFVEIRFRQFNMEHSRDYKVTFDNGEWVCF